MLGYPNNDDSGIESLSAKSITNNTCYFFCTSQSLTFSEHELIWTSCIRRTPITINIAQYQRDYNKWLINKIIELLSYNNYKKIEFVIKNINNFHNRVFGEWDSQPFFSLWQEDACHRASLVIQWRDRTRRGGGGVRSRVAGRTGERVVHRLLRCCYTLARLCV